MCIWSWCQTFRFWERDTPEVSETGAVGEGRSRSRREREEKGEGAEGRGLPAGGWVIVF